MKYRIFAILWLIIAIIGGIWIPGTPIAMTALLASILFTIGGALDSKLEEIRIQVKIAQLTGWLKPTPELLEKLKDGEKK
jgi:hypothetical protein